MHGKILYAPCTDDDEQLFIQNM